MYICTHIKNFEKNIDIFLKIMLYLFSYYMFNRQYNKGLKYIIFFHSTYYNNNNTYKLCTQHIFIPNKIFF